MVCLTLLFQLHLQYALGSSEERKLYSEQLKGRDKLRDVVVDGKILLKWFVMLLNLKLWPRFDW